MVNDVEKISYEGSTLVVVKTTFLAQVYLAIILVAEVRVALLHPTSTICSVIVRELWVAVGSYGSIWTSAS